MRPATHQLSPFGLTWAALALACVGTVLGCGPTTKLAAVSSTNLTGTVTDAAGAVVAGAQVSAGGGAALAVTDSSGHYALGIGADKVVGGALAVYADRYAPVSRQVALSSAVQNFVLRPYDVVVPIVLPTGNAEPVSAKVTRGEGTVTLTIPSDSMVTSAGLAASGNAEVRLTYWNPAADLADAPGSLAARLGSNSNMVLALQSLGMVDVQVVQGDTALQVAAGKTLGLDEALPPMFTQAMNQRPTGVHDPFLFYLDMDAGVWVLDGNLTYDANAGLLHGLLPHLTTWNFDLFENWNPPASCTTDDVLNSRGDCAKPETSDLGGCVAGRALQKDGTVLANQSVRLWLFDWEHISAIDVTTDATGTYCVDVGIRLCVPYANDPVCTYSANTVSYHLSSPASPTLSSLANPVPSQCASQSGAYSYATYSTIQYFNDCGLVNDDATSQTGSVAPLTAPSTASIKACSYCSGQGPGFCSVSGASLTNTCTALPDVTLASGAAASTSSAAVCAQLLKLGDSCTAKTAMCCPSGTECSDYVCVPVLGATN